MLSAPFASEMKWSNTFSATFDFCWMSAGLSMGNACNEANEVRRAFTEEGDRLGTDKLELESLAWICHGYGCKCKYTISSMNPNRDT